MTLDANGKELTRERLRPGGGLMRVAPTAAEAAATAAARGARGGGSRGRAGAGRRGPRPRGAAVGRGTAEPGRAVRLQAGRLERRRRRHRRQHPAAVGEQGRRQRGGRRRRRRGARHVRTDRDLRRRRHGRGALPGRVVPRSQRQTRSRQEQLSPNFRMLRLTPFYYSFASAAADFDRDGNMDVVSGPFIFLGPDFTKKREFYLALATQPGVSISRRTGSSSPATSRATAGRTCCSRRRRAAMLYVNPERRAAPLGRLPERHSAGPSVAEVSVMKDIDGDGKPDLVYMSGGAIRWAKPDPANPTGPWLSTQVGEPGTYVAHGIGAGDINGDGNAGHPATRTAGGNNPRQGRHADSGRITRQAVRPLERPRRGRRRRDVRLRRQRRRPERRRDVAPGARVRARVVRAEARRVGHRSPSCEHMISDDFATKNAGGVTFSEPHGSTCRRHGRRRHPRLRRRQAVLLAPGELHRSRSATARRCSTSTGRCATRRRPAARSSCPSSCTTRRAPARSSSPSISTRTASSTSSRRGELGTFVFLRQAADGVRGRSRHGAPRSQGAVITMSAAMAAGSRELSSHGRCRSSHRWLWLRRVSAGQRRRTRKPWTSYGGSADSSRYFNSKQITKSQRQPAAGRLDLPVRRSRLSSADRPRHRLRPRPRRRDRRARRQDRQGTLDSRRHARP